MSDDAMNEVELHKDEPGPVKLYPPYPPFVEEPVPPSVPETIQTGRKIRLKCKTRPPVSVLGPPAPAAPRTPRATDVPMTRKELLAHHKCMDRHNIVLSDRLEKMSKPNRRLVIGMWREHYDILPPEAINRFRCMLDADVPFGPDQAYQYFMNCKKSRKRGGRNKAGSASRICKPVCTDKSVACRQRRYFWAHNATIAFARGIQARLAQPGCYQLCGSTKRLANVILGDVCCMLRCKKPAKRARSKKCKYAIEMADKVAVWINDILDEADERMLVMDADEDEEVMAERDGYADDFLDMMGGKGGGRKKKGPPAASSLKGEDREAFQLLTTAMDRKGNQVLLKHGQMSQTYAEASKEMKTTPEFESDYDPAVHQKLVSALSDSVKNITPKNLDGAMSNMVDTAAKHLATKAEHNKEKGPEFQHLLKTMRQSPGTELYTHDGETRNMARGAAMLEDARGLAAPLADPNLTNQISKNLNKLLGDSAPPEMKQAMPGIIDKAAKYLAHAAVEEASGISADGRPLGGAGAMSDAQRQQMIKDGLLNADGSPLTEAQKQKLIREGKMTADGRPISEAERQQMIKDGLINADGSPLTEAQKQKLIREGKMTADGRPISTAERAQMIKDGLINADGSPLTEEQKQKLIREGKMTPDGRIIPGGGRAAGGAGGAGGPMSEAERQRMIKEGLLNADGSPLTEAQKQKLIREGKMTADGRPISEAERQQMIKDGLINADGSPLTEAQKQKLIREGKMTADGRPISAAERAQMIKDGLINADGSPLTEEQKQKLIREGKMTPDGRIIPGGGGTAGGASGATGGAAAGVAGGAGGPMSEAERQRMIKEGLLNADGSPLTEAQKQKLIREGKMTADGRPISEAERQQMIKDGLINADGSPLTEAQKQKLIREGKMTADGRPISAAERAQMIKDGLINADGSPLTEEQKQKLIREGKMTPDGRIIPGGGGTAGGASGATGGAAAGVAGGASGATGGAAAGVAGGAGGPMSEAERQRMIKEGLLNADGSPLTEAQKQKLIREGKMTADGRPISAAERAQMIKDGLINADGSPLTEEQKQKLIREGKMTPDGRIIPGGGRAAGGAGGAGGPMSEAERQRMIKEGLLNADGSPLTEAQKQKLIREGKMTADGRPISEAERQQMIKDGLINADGSPLTEAQKQKLIREGKMTADGRPISAAERAQMIKDGLINADGSPLTEAQRQKLIREGKMTADGRPISEAERQRMIKEGLINADGSPLTEAQRQKLIREGKMTADGRPISEAERQRMIKEGLINADGSPLTEAQKAKLIREGRMTPDGRIISEEERQQMIRDGLINADGSPLTEAQKQKLIREGKMTADGRLIYRAYETEEERLRRLETDPKIRNALGLLLKELKDRGNEVFYKQPHNQFTYAEAAEWLQIKPKKKIENSVRESSDTARLTSKIESKLTGMMNKKTPPELKDAMQDIIVESARTLSEYFVSENYKAVAKDGLIRAMQKKGEEIMVGDHQHPETFFYAAQRLKKVDPKASPEVDCNLARYIAKKMDYAARTVSMPRKLYPSMKDHIEEAAGYLSTRVTQPDDYITAYVTLLKKMDDAGNELLFDGTIPMTFKKGADYLREQTKLKDPKGKENKLLSIATIPKLVAKINSADERTDSKVANAVASDAAALLVSYIQLEAEKTRLLKMLINEMEKNYKSTLLHHGPVIRTMGDGVEILKGKTTADMKITENVEPVVARKIQIRLNNLFGCLCPPDPYEGLMIDVIEEVTQYLAVSLLDPFTGKIHTCKCPKKSTQVQCELWNDEILRRVPNPCCSCSRAYSDSTLPDIDYPTSQLRASPTSSRLHGPGIDITIRTCPGPRSRSERYCKGPESKCPGQPPDCENDRKNKPNTSSTYFVTTIYDKPVKVEVGKSSGSSDRRLYTNSVITFETQTSIKCNINTDDDFHNRDMDTVSYNVVNDDEKQEEKRSPFDRDETVMFTRPNYYKQNTAETPQHSFNYQQQSEQQQSDDTIKRVSRYDMHKANLKRLETKINTMPDYRDRIKSRALHKSPYPKTLQWQGIEKGYDRTNNSLQSRLPMYRKQDMSDNRYPQTSMNMRSYQRYQNEIEDSSISPVDHKRSNIQGASYATSRSPPRHSLMPRPQSLLPPNKILRSPQGPPPLLKKYPIRAKSPGLNKYPIRECTNRQVSPGRKTPPYKSPIRTHSPPENDKKPTKDRHVNKDKYAAGGSNIRSRSPIMEVYETYIRTKSPPRDDNAIKVLENRSHSPNRNANQVIEVPLVERPERREKRREMTGSEVVTTDEMGDWHAMMISIMWNVQAWRDLIQENIDRGFNHGSNPDDSDDLWTIFSRRIETECLQWMQYNKFSRQLMLRLNQRYSNKIIKLPDRQRTRTEEYSICLQEMLDILEMSDWWTEWIYSVIQECDSIRTSSTNISHFRLRWVRFKKKIIERLDDWTQLKIHLKNCWGKRFTSLIEAWIPTWLQESPLWVVSACGAVPSGAVPAGTFEGQVTWVARTTHSGQVLPAALMPSRHCCVVYADGDVHHYTKYQVLCNANVIWMKRNPNSYSAPCERAVRAAPGVCIGRVEYQGTHLIGAVKAPHYRCHTVIYQRSFAFNCYELLVLAEDD